MFVELMLMMSSVVGVVVVFVVLLKCLLDVVDFGDFVVGVAGKVVVDCDLVVVGCLQLTNSG